MARRAKKTRDEGELKIGIQGFVRTLAVDAKTGKVLAERKTKNVVVDGGRDEIIRLISTTLSGTKITHLGLGTGTTAVNVTQTNLVASTGARAALLTGSLLTPGTVQYTASFDTAFASGSVPLCEVGLFNSSSSGTMFARALFGTITKTSEMTLAFTYQLNFTTG